MAIKNKVIITLFVLSAAMVLLVVFAVLPLFKAIIKNSRDVVSARQEIASLSAEMDNFALLESKYAEYNPVLEKIDNLFINEEIPVDFINFMENLASSSGVLVVVSPGPGASGFKSDLKSVDFSAAVQGSFVDFSRYLEKLENSQYLIEVYGLSVISEKTTGGVSANINLKVLAK
jgi:hypothetical protein